MADSYYESEQLLNEYLLFHYGSPQDELPWRFGPVDALDFPARCVGLMLDRSSLPADARALDLGCAVGRSAFELSAFCQEVIGIDYSARFVEAAEKLAREGNYPFQIVETGTRVRQACARLPAHARPEKVRFEQGDAMALQADLGKFDVVLACNLLCRLSEPGRLLDRLAELVRPGGQLVLTTPNTWLETFTAKEFWLGATPATGEPLEAIRSALAPAFVLERRLDLPFLIREHRRKYQWSVAEGTLWRRR